MDKQRQQQGGLFTCWGQSDVKGATEEVTDADTGNVSVNFDFGILDDDEDDVLAQAYDNSMGMDTLHAEKLQDVMPTGQAVRNGTGSQSHPLIPQATPLETLPGFDADAGKTWIYPINYPIRDYQFCIVEKVLYKNTLVSLPTGLGKTFIAAVVMYNFYRWYPRSKIVFMAPTKPLVAQQVEACFNVMGIPQEDTSQMTGSMTPENRIKAWTEKRMFFLTPQVLTNDLARGALPGAQIKCLVLDEAHRALGNHAYCQVVRGLREYRHDFRILALSATPGSDVRAVQQVLTNLMISHIELRSEESPDIQEYVHKRSIDKVVVPLGVELTSLKIRYLNVLRVYVSKLLDMRVLYTKDETTLTKYQILQAREAFRQNPPDNLPRQKYGVVEGLFALCMTLYHSYELMLQHGTRSFYKFLKGTLEGDKGHSFARSELLRNRVFQELMEEIAHKFDSESILPKSSEKTSSRGSSQVGGAECSKVNAEVPYVVSHPKLVKLLTIVLGHHKKYANEGKSTRIMIFSQYRDSVMEITEMLQRHYPLVKAMSFVGQSTVARGGRGFSQKEQLKVVKEFREGGFNTLIATCVGEEGLDIGEVDLIICYDAPKSPIRLVQRMGRTGRKRDGRIVVLVTAGKEEQMYNQSQYQKKSINAVLADKNRLNRFLSPHSANMIPRGITPVCMKLHMKVGTWKIQTGRGRKSSVGPTTSIASMLGNSGPSPTNKRKDCVNNSGLSKEEFSWWRENLEVPLNELKSIPRPSLLCHSKHDTKEDFNSMLYINLGMYQPWHTMAQNTHVMGHSSRTLHLVQLAEFIGLQQHFDVNDDPYGLEMAAFLDMAYIEGNTVQKPSMFSSVRSDVHRDSQQILQGSGEIKKGKEKKKASASTRKGAKKSVQSCLITSMFSQKPRIHVEESKLSNCQDLEDFDVANKDTNEDQSEMEISEVEVIDAEDIEHVVIPSVSPCKKNTEACDHMLEFLNLLPPKQRSPLHIPDPPDASDFSDDDQEFEPSSPTDIINVYNEWIEKTMDVAKNVFKLKNGGIGASDAVDVSINHVQRLNCVESKLMSLNETNDSLVELPDLQGHQENIYKKSSTAEVSLEVSPVLGNKMTSTTSQIKSGSQKSDCGSSDTELVTSRDIFGDSTVPSDQNVSPVLSSSYKKPVRTNLKLYSSTPKVTAKRLFKIATPDLTGIEQNSPFSRELDTSCTPVKSHSAANLRREQLIQRDSENAELEARGLPSGLSYRNKVRSKLSRFTIPENTKSEDKPEISSSQKYQNPIHTSKGIDTRQISSVSVMTNKEVLTNKDIMTNENLMTNKDLMTNKAVMINKNATTNKAVITNVDIMTNNDVVTNKDVMTNKDVTANKYVATSKAMTNKDVMTDKFVATNKDVTTHNSRECSVNFDLSLDDDLFVDIEEEEEEDKTNRKESPDIEVIEQNRKPFVIPTRQSLSKTNTGPLAGTASALLSVTQIIDLVNESTDNISCKVVDNAETSSPSFLKNTVKLTGMLSKPLLSKSNGYDQSVKNSVSTETVKQSNCLEGPNFSLLDGLASDDEDKPDGVKEESSNEQSVHFDLLGTDEFDVESESLLADIELNIQMKDEGRKTQGKKGISYEGRCIDKENKDKYILKNNMHSTEYQASQNLTGNTSPEILKFIDTVLSPTQENSHIWKRKRKRHNVVGSDTEDYVTLSSDSENDTLGRSGSLLTDKSSSSGNNIGINRKKKKMFGVKKNFEDDDDFDEDSTAAFQKMQQKSENSRKQPQKDMKKKNLFIEDEAEVSENDDCVSSDEQEDDEGNYDHSFVDDCTQLTQDTSIDMKAVYLQSVVSPLKMAQKNRRHNEHQLSDTDESTQEMEEDEDEDSFVVDNNFVEYDTEYMGDTMLAEDPIIAQALDDEVVSKKSKDAENGSKTKRKRIINCESSSDEESGNHNSKDKSDLSLLRHVRDDCSSSLPKSSCTSIQDRGFVMQRDSTKNKTPSTVILSLTPSDKLQIIQHRESGRLHSSPERSIITSKLSENDQSTGGSNQVRSLSRRYSADPQRKTQLPSPERAVARIAPLQNKLFCNSGSEGFCMPSEELKKDDKETRVARVLPSKSNSLLASSMRTEPVSSIPDPVTGLKVSGSNVKMPLQNKHMENQCSTNLSESKPGTSTFTSTRQVAAVVLVDSCEISGGGNIVSKMRLQYGVSTAVVQLAHAHYAVSTRMAVTRLLHSVFSSSQQRGKLVQRVQGMLDLYERPVIIVEMDRVKAGESSHHGQSRSKYLDTITCASAQVTQLKVLYSSGQEETTSMLLQLVEQESSKGYSIPVMPEHLTQLKQVVNFYLSLPRMSYATALCLAKNFRTIANFINSSAEMVRDKGRMSIQRAAAIKQYLQRDFRPDMLPPH